MNDPDFLPESFAGSELVVFQDVEASGGSVRVVDSPIGGARFLIRLPLAPDQ